MNKGKAATALAIEMCIRDSPEDEVVIFDPAGEYGNLVGALGGANVELAPGCSAVLNPLDTADVADRALSLIHI